MGKLYINTERPSKIYVNASAVQKVYLNTEEVWSSAPLWKNYLHFTCLQGGSYITIPVELHCQYSYDQITWTTPTQTITLYPDYGQTVYLRCNGTSYPSPGYNFTIIGMVEAGGNVMSLFDSTLENNEFPTGCNLNHLFKDCHGLISAPELPATTLPEKAYWCMFTDCDSLIVPPKINGQGTMGYDAMDYMFEDCSALYVQDSQSTTYSAQWNIPETGTATSQHQSFIGKWWVFQGCPGTRMYASIKWSNQQRTYYTQYTPGGLRAPTSLQIQCDWDGTEHTNDYVCPPNVEMVGVDKGRACGSYTATYTPKSGYTWRDGTTTSITVELIIRRRVGGRIYYDAGDNGNTYRFFDSNGSEITSRTIEGLANAYYYTKNGNNGIRWLVYYPTLYSGYNWESVLNRHWAWSTGVGGGQINTNTVLNDNVNGQIWTSIRSMRNNSTGWRNDWYVPCRDEIDLLRQSGLINEWFSNCIWSSEETNSPYSLAYYWFATYWGSYSKQNVGCYFAIANM